MKITPPGGNAREPRARGLSAREVAQRMAIEKSLCRYIQLSCGHLQTVETGEVYAFCSLVVLGTIQLYCERCGDFRTIEAKRIKVELPDNPLF